MRSPIRPAPPPLAPLQTPEVKTELSRTSQELQAVSTPSSALNTLRRKMELIAGEFAEGKINRAQFNAVYGRYSEQRAIIERMIERNPNSKAWKQVISARGHTSFLRQHFESHPLYFLVYQHDADEPLITGGKKTPDMERILPVLRTLWGMGNRPKAGLARKAMGEGQWLVLALGDQAVTLVMFHLEPSLAQANLVRDLHNDFERANRSSLEQGAIRHERMVFPQRALVEDGLA